MPEAIVRLERAVQHFQAGELFQAVSICRQILLQNPNSAGALHLLGVIAFQAGRNDAALELIRQAVAFSPGDPVYHCNLGNALMAGGQMDEAVACYKQALVLQPAFAVAHANLGIALKGMGLLAEAIDCYRRALAIEPQTPKTLNDLGNALIANGQLDDAIASYRQALAVKPGYAEAQNNLGIALKAGGLLDEAIDCFRMALAGEPDSPAFHSNLIYTLHYDYRSGTEAIAEELRRWNERHATPLKKSIRPHLNDRAPERRLRIGYVSPDFRVHAAAHFLTPLLESHDHRQFEIHCYSSVACPDRMTARLAQCADQWHGVAGWGNERLADQVRLDQIDILVDLTLHMAQNRLPLFARKPAPVQVTWLAYPGSSGLETMDYRLTDPYLEPPGMNDRLYSEEPVRLPDSFWCYDPLGGGPEVNPLPAGERGCITFGCLNNPCKLNEQVLRLWARVLKSVNGSRLLLLAHEGSQRLRICSMLKDEEIETGRVEFASYAAGPEYLKLYHRIDVGLDTFPYNGHTTSLDAFWMGVPGVTLKGQTAVGRAGNCLLTNLALPELVAQTAEEFVGIAAELARDLPRLAALRSTLRQRMQSSPLMDAPRFARAMEGAYRAMWRKWCAEG
jgi:predicted O-linked N-acetylglucosamine transferase (SPINDLY family)